MRKIDIQRSVNMTWGAIKGLSYEEASELPPLEGEDLKNRCLEVGVKSVKRDTLEEMVVQTGTSKSESRRLVENKGVTIDEEFLFIGKKDIWVII